MKSLNKHFGRGSVLEEFRRYRKRKSKVHTGSPDCGLTSRWNGFFEYACVRQVLILDMRVFLKVYREDLISPFFS